jgi:hypothetical protein
MAPFNFDLSVGTVYPTLKDAAIAVQQMTTARGESYYVRRGEKKRWVVVCRDEKNCNFCIRVSDIVGKGKITINKPHSCPPETHANWHVAISVRLLSQHHRDAVVDNRNIPPSQILSSERLQQGNTVLYHQAWRTRKALRRDIEGSEEESFQKLPALCEALRAGEEGIL